MFGHAFFIHPFVYSGSFRYVRKLILTFRSQYNQDMLKYIFYICCGFFLGSCYSEADTEIYIRITGSDPDVPVVLSVGEQDYSLILDSMGIARMDLSSLSEASEGVLRHGVYNLPLFIEPHRSFEIYVSLYPENLGAEFNGIGGLKNEIWNGKYFRHFPDSVYAFGEEAFIDEIEKSRQENRYILDSLGNDASFTEVVMKKAELFVLEMLTQYPNRHADLSGELNFVPSDAYLGYVSKQLKDKGDLFRYGEYRRILTEWVSFCVGLKLSARHTFRELQYRLNFVDSSFTDANVEEYLVHKFVMDYVEREGIDSLARIKRIYDLKVKQSDLRKNFNDICQSWQRILPGQPCRTFVCRENDTTTVSLSDFRGHYVYMVLWGLDCKPSRSILTYFRDYALRLKNRNIIFAGVACQGEWDRWKTVVQEMKPGGIQLFLEESEDLLNFFKVERFPRFILLDPDGRIVEAWMSSPADPGTFEKLKKIAGKSS